MLTIRPTTAEDLPVVYQFICDLEEEILPYEAFSRVFLHNLQSSDIKGWLAMVGSGENLQPAGFISVHLQHLLHHAALVAEVQELYVLAAYRGQAIGKLLLATATEWTVTKGCLEIEVTSNQVRKDAHRFYVREGYTNSHFKLTKKL